MIQLEELQEEIKMLPHHEFVKLRDWIIEQDWMEWDKQIERDAASGKLDFLIEEAKREKYEGKLRNI